MLTVIKMLAVFGLLGFTLWYIRRYDGKRMSVRSRRTGRPIEIVGQAKLSKNASVAVVRIGDATYAVGVTDHQVSLLTQAPVELEVETAEDAVPAGVDPELLAEAGALLARSRSARPSFGEALRTQLSGLRHPRSADGPAATAAGRVPSPRVALSPGTRRLSPSEARTPQL